MKCAECSKDYKGRTYNSEFCGTPCRRTFNNRRAVRGALLYDLTMLSKQPLNFERNPDSRFYDWPLRIETQIALWEAEDAGRRTWQRARAVAEATVKLVAMATPR
jgi:hypothetical protein